MFYSKDPETGEKQIGVINNRWLYLGLDIPFKWHILIDEPLHWSVSEVIHTGEIGPVSFAWSLTGSLTPE